MNVVLNTCVRIGRARIIAVLAVAAVAWSAEPVLAADLGGDCCADLEERIAELEATAARKGNRKVSLTISGYIAQELTWWDDGEESNAYLHGLGPTQATNVRFGGQAQISPGWTAGFLIRIQNLSDDPFGRLPNGDAMNQNDPNLDRGLNTQMAYWYIQNKELGKISVGRMAHAGKSTAMGTDQSGTQIIDSYTLLAGFPQFIIRTDGDLSPPQLTWGQLAFCYSQSSPLGGDCNGIVLNGVRYDTPTVAGFTASASWGEDDFWEVALRYSQEISGFKVAFGTGYSEFTIENVTGPLPAGSRKDSKFFQVGGYLQHMASGLFVHAAYGHENNSDTTVVVGTPATQVTPPDSNQWYVKAGIRRAWTPLGATIVYGDYAEYLDQVGPNALGLGIESSTFRRSGATIAPAGRGLRQRGGPHQLLIPPLIGHGLRLWVSLGICCLQLGRRDT
ncbi:MAG: porin [Hyphomicrobium sp.]|nr:porin [Hyphomicrobium sp.]